MSTGNRERRTQERLDRAQEQIDRAQERMDRGREEIERGRERMERGRGSEDAEPIWARPEPGARSPRLSRDQIAAKAMEIADRDGVEKVSMRRVAAELGSGTMTLYHYVNNKQELLDLVHDEMMSELLVDPASLEGDWREALTAIAEAAYGAWSRHRWLSHSLPSRPYIGPNAIRHFDQSLQAAATTGLPLEQRLEVISQIDDYVAGYAERERELLTGGAPADRKEEFEAMVRPFSEYMSEQLEAGDFPHVREFVGDGDVADAVWQVIQGSDPRERFERGLARLLDGVEAEIARAAGG